MASIEDAGRGVVYTRTGRRFFNDEVIEGQLLARVSAALENAGLYAELRSDWLVLDCELMPWSAQAQDLLRQQYAAVGAAGACITECFARVGRVFVDAVALLVTGTAMHATPCPTHARGIAT